MAKITTLDQGIHERSKVAGRLRTQLVGKEISNSKFMRADTVTYQPNASGGEHYHKCESFIYIMKGECDFTINGTTHHIREGTMVFLAPGDKHYLKNIGSSPMIMLEAFAPISDSESFWTNPDEEHGWTRE